MFGPRGPQVRRRLQYTTIMVFYDSSGVSYGNSLHTVYPTIDLLYVFVQNSPEAFCKRLEKNIENIFFS